jgi:DNA-binding MarR family transcriptional regulator
MVKRLKQSVSAIPAAGEGKRGKDGYLAYLLRQASAATRLSLDRALADLDVTLPQFSALVMIGSYDQLSSADLARLTLLTPQTVNIIVRNLEERGAVIRTPHAVHGRILVLAMTNEGKRLLSTCRKRADEVEARLYACLRDGTEKDVVRRWLADVARTLGTHETPSTE